MPEISTHRPAPAAPPGNRPPAVSAADLAIKLLKPLEGQLAAGETVKAEVLALREANNSFQVLLRMTLDSGRQSTLEASSNKPLTPGSTVLATALSDTRLALTLVASDKRLLSSLDLQQLPLGSLLQARVEHSEALPAVRGQQALYRVLATLLNGPQAGSKLSIDSPQPLTTGSLLSAQVQGSQQLAFLPLSGRLEQLALQQQLAGQLSRQGSLEALVGNLQGAASNNALPDALRNSINSLLALLPDGKQLSSSEGLAKALGQSGVFLEARLLAGHAQQLPADLKANLLRLVAQMQLSLPGGAVPGSAAAPLNPALPAMLRSALGQLEPGQLRQQALSFPLPGRLLQSLDGEADLETLLKLAAAAISRLQTHQLSSLAQTHTLADGTQQTTWQLELPMRDQQALVPLQLKLQHEQPAPEKRQESGESLWRIELAFDLPPLGALQAQLQLQQGALSGQLWAEQAATVRLVNHELDHLRQRLLDAGLHVTELNCQLGQPARNQAARIEQHWVDERA